jgi:hypothetical protein
VLVSHLVNKHSTDPPEGAVYLQLVKSLFLIDVVFIKSAKTGIGCLQDNALQTSGAIS